MTSEKIDQFNAKNSKQPLSRDEINEMFLELGLEPSRPERWREKKIVDHLYGLERLRNLRLGKIRDVGPEVHDGDPDKGSAQERFICLEFEAHYTPRNPPEANLGAREWTDFRDEVSQDLAHYLGWSGGQLATQTYDTKPEWVKKHGIYVPTGMLRNSRTGDVFSALYCPTRRAKRDTINTLTLRVTVEEGERK